MHITSDEIGLALSWYQRDINTEQRAAIRKAMKSLDALHLDSNMVLIAAYRLDTRTKANSIPWPRE